MGFRSSKPNVRGVLDLGMRDVGVENDPRAPYREYVKSLPKVLALVFGLLMVTCLIVGLTGGAALALPVLALGWVGGIVLLAQRAAKRARPTSIRVTADGTNQAVPLMIAMSALLVLASLLTRSLLFLPVALLMAGVAAMAWRRRDWVPEVLRNARSLLEADESVVGDGVGNARGEYTSWKKGFRLIVATDRRLLVTGSGRSSQPFVLTDVPYDHVSRFGVAFKQLGMTGTLSLTVDGAEHVINMIPPANLLSIATALQAHGVPADDPAVIAEAERAWAEAREDVEPVERPVALPAGAPERPVASAPAPRKRSEPLFNPAAMSTPEFDRGLWLLLGLAAVVFYLNPFGIGLGMRREAGVALLLLVPVTSGVCGYVSRSKSSLAYLVPLNLLVSPAFFFADTSLVIYLMIMLSAAAALGLWVGSALRRARDGDAATIATGPVPEVDRNSLRGVLSGRNLIRLTGIMLATLTALAVVSTAAGFPLTNLRLAIDERTFKKAPVDGKSDLTGDYASLRYTPDGDLREFITDGPRGGQPGGGERWELRSSWRRGYNTVTLARYVYEPRLDDPKAIADFVAEKDREHTRLAGRDVTHTERVVDGRKGYVWNHGSWTGRWYYAAWFPQPVHTVRVECIATKQKAKFKRLCAEAVASLKLP